MPLPHLTCVVGIARKTSFCSKSDAPGDMERKSKVRVDTYPKPSWKCDR